MDRLAASDHYDEDYFRWQRELGRFSELVQCRQIPRCRSDRANIKGVASGSSRAACRQHPCATGMMPPRRQPSDAKGERVRARSRRNHSEPVFEPRIPDAAASSIGASPTVWRVPEQTIPEGRESPRGLLGTKASEDGQVSANLKIDHRGASTDCARRAPGEHGRLETLHVDSQQSMASRP
jgi:hypothetical protein